MYTYTNTHIYVQVYINMYVSVHIHIVGDYSGFAIALRAFQIH